MSQPLQPPPDAAPSVDIAAILAEHFLFADLDRAELEQLAGRVWMETIPAGSRIVREGDAADALYVVVEGGVNVIKATGQFLSFLGRGRFFGEMALFLRGAKRSASCLAATDTTCLVVQKEVLDTFTAQNPNAGMKVYRAIIQTLAERLQSTSADLAHLMAAHSSAPMAPTGSSPEQ